MLLSLHTLYSPAQPALAATEASDTASLALSAAHTASLTATEAGDTANFLLGDMRTATLAATEAGDTASFALNAAHTATLTATEAADTAALALTATHTAALVATEAGDTASIALTAKHTAALAATEAADTAAIAAGIVITLSFAPTEGADTAAIAAGIVLPLDAALAATEGADTALISAEAVRDRQPGGGGRGRRIRYLIYKDDEVAEVEAEAPPKQLRKRKLSPDLVFAVDALLPRLLGHTPQSVKALLPPTLYVPTGPTVDVEQMAAALAAYLQRLADEDEEDIETLLLAA